LSTGRVVRAIAGFFYVEPLDAPMAPIECSVRGKLKLKAETISVGDRVVFAVENGKGVITGVLARENLLKRPYIANVDLIVLVFAFKDPDPNEFLITKFLILAEQTGIPYLLVFNKADLATPEEAGQVVAIYRECGYRVFATSVLKNQGKAELLEIFRGKTAVLAGPSGVGKSALLNLLAPGFRLQTGDVSRKIGRGRHTTREVQLLRINEHSYVADTPGFTQIALDGIDPANFKSLFPDFSDWEPNCRFNGCLHQTEPDCGIKQAVAEGKISVSRYQTYLTILAEITENWKNRYR
jgi:ribosome biogenesis GTPase